MGNPRQGNRVPPAAAGWGTPAAAGIAIFQNPQARTHRDRNALHLVLGEVL